MWLPGVLLVLSTPPASAQEASITGVVRVGELNADTGTVVLHRVGAAFAGEVDTVAVAPGGGFSFRLPAAAVGENGVYFASVRHDGVLYFGPAIHDSATLDSVYVIQAYPSRVAGPGTGIPVRARNVFAEATDTGWTLTDLFEVSNPGSATLIAPAGGYSWAHRLPDGATDLDVGQSDLSPEETTLEGGRLQTAGAVPPGESIFLVQYRVDDSGLRIPSDTPTESFELLIREPAPSVSVSGLAALDPVELEGVTYRRFAATSLPPTTVRLSLGAEWRPADSIPWLAALLAMVLAVAGGAVAVRRGRTADRRAVVVEIARLDEALASGAIGADEHQRRREELVARIR